MFLHLYFSKSYDRKFLRNVFSKTCTFIVKEMQSTIEIYRLQLLSFVSWMIPRPFLNISKHWRNVYNKTLSKNPSLVWDSKISKIRSPKLIYLVVLVSHKLKLSDLLMNHKLLIILIWYLWVYLFYLTLSQVNVKYQTLD